MRVAVFTFYHNMLIVNNLIQIIHRVPDDLTGYKPHKEFAQPDFQALPKEVALHVYSVGEAGSQRGSQREDDDDGKAEKCGIFSGFIYFFVYVMQCFSECMQARLSRIFPIVLVRQVLQRETAARHEISYFQIMYIRQFLR